MSSLRSRYFETCTPAQKSAALSDLMVLGYRASLDNDVALRVSVLRSMLVFARTSPALYDSVAQLAARLADEPAHQKLAAAALKEVIDTRRSLDAVGVQAYAVYAPLVLASLDTARNPLALLNQLVSSPFYGETTRELRRDILFSVQKVADTVRPSKAVPVLHQAVIQTPEEQRNRERLSMKLVTLAKTFPKTERNQLYGYVLAHPRHAPLAQKEAAKWLGFYARQWPYGSAMDGLTLARDEVFGPNALGRKLAKKEIIKTADVKHPHDSAPDHAFDDFLRGKNIINRTGAGLSLC